MQRDQQSARVDKIKMKLRQERSDQKEYFQFMQAVQPSGSRQAVVPGRTEAQDEGIRQQLLVGKLKSRERLAANLAEQEADELARSSPAWTSAGGVQPRGDQAEASEQSLQHRSGQARKYGGFKDLEACRAIPQILSDQASAAGVSSVRDKDAQGAKGRREARPEESGEPARGFIISREASSRGLGQCKRDTDYKPHDHAAIEETLEAQALGGHYQSKAQAMNKGIKFITTFKEPEPEQMLPTSERGPRSPHQKATAEPKAATNTQTELERLICEIQSMSQQQEGYFIYLRQNAANERNPYDLVPFKYTDLENQSREPIDLFASPEVEDKSRAAKNLNVLEEHKRNKARQIYRSRKVFKSEYHRYENDSKRQQEGQGGKHLKYYTLAKRGITAFIDNEPIEFIKIENWLAERAQFN